MFFNFSGYLKDEQEAAALNPLLSIRDLSIAFGKKPNQVVVTDNVTFDIYPGEILALVGESGCGKSVTAMSILGLLPRQARILSGEILYDKKDLLHLNAQQLDQVRGKDISMIFQDIMYSLNPVFTIGNQLREGMRRHLHISREEADHRALELLTRTGIQDASDVLKKFPHQLSGGQRQRVMITMALSCNPKLLIADEPTTALDVTIQLQIIQLLRSLREETGMAIFLITHDIGLVSEIADRIIVMYAGQCVEIGPAREVLTHPRHAYTDALLRAVPDINHNHDHLLSIPGNIPERYDRLHGCRFSPRCSAVSNCPFRKLPELEEVAPGHFSRCPTYGKKVYSDTNS